MQKVWRGERPQLGRMREFYQCDIDVIHVDNLPLHFDAEMPKVIYEALEGLDIGRIQLRISNRKILFGFLQQYGIDDQNKIILITRAVDKLEKIGKEEVIIEILDALERYDTNDNLIADDGTPTANVLNGYGEQNNNIIEFARSFIDIAEQEYRSSDDLKEKLTNNENIDTSSPMIQEGIEELSFVLDELSHLPDHAVKADLSIVRGLDYYTGTVYETQLLDIPEFKSSVCSGGRYDDLAGSYINKHLPGVGISIGFTRLFDVLRHNGYIKNTKKCPTDVLVVLPSEDMRAIANETARALRSNGHNVEVYHAPQKISKQIGFAEKKGINYVWFPDLNEVKNLQTGEQLKTDPKMWEK